MAIQIRECTYRGEEGFKICGKPRGQVGGWGVSIFVAGRDAQARADAELVRENVKAGISCFEGCSFWKDKEVERANSKS